MIPKTVAVVEKNNSSEPGKLDRDEHGDKVKPEELNGI